MSSCCYLINLDGIEPRRESVPVTIYGPPAQLPPLCQPLPTLGWDVIDGEFIMVHASYQSHIGSDCFLAPGAQLNDGIIWLMVVRAGVSRNQLLQVRVKFLLHYAIFQSPK